MPKKSMKPRCGVEVEVGAQSHTDVALTRACRTCRDLLVAGRYPSVHLHPEEGLAANQEPL